MQTQQKYSDKSLSKLSLPRDSKEISLFYPQSKLSDIVLPSETSKTAFKTKKGKISNIQFQIREKGSTQGFSLQRSNFLKRESNSDVETKKYQSQIRKKRNEQPTVGKRSKQEIQMNFKQVSKVFEEQDDNFFNLQSSFSASQKNAQQRVNQIQQISQKSQKIVFPDRELQPLNESRNQLIKRTIQIMSNTNQKIGVPIHEGLFKSNTSHKNQYLQQKWSEIPNLCDFRMKNQYSQSIQFIRQYKSGYAPIQMQKRNQEPQEQIKQVNQMKGKNKDKSRNHFIRKQQSSFTLPRTCGVSYIKPSQSDITQIKPFLPLPPLIFQGSTTCFIVSAGQTATSLDISKKQSIHKFILSLQNGWLPFIISNEDQMRDLLLGHRTKSTKVGFVHGAENLWPLYVQGTFILILFAAKAISTQKQVWQIFGNKETYFKIGILSRKSTSGRKAFLKSIKVGSPDSTSLATQQTNQNQPKNQCTNQLPSQKNTPSLYDKLAGNQIKECPSEQNKISNTFETLEEQLKDNRTVVTMSLRLEMYVEEINWKQSFTRQNKQMLNQIIMTLKDKLEKKSIRIIQQRFQIEKDGKFNHFDRKFSFLRKPNTLGSPSINQPNVNNEQVNGINLPFLSGQRPLSIDNFIEDHHENSQLYTTNEGILFQSSQICSASDFLQKTCSSESWRKSFKFPIYYISTRDSFAFDLIEKKSILRRGNGREYTKIQYYFYPDNVPGNFSYEYRKLFPQLDVGATSYHGFFTEQELKQFEQNTFSMEKKAFKNQFLQMTVQTSIVSTKIKRTKFFFGYRYMWTRCQLSQPCSYVGAGVRKDVTYPPSWTKKISDQMIKENIVQKDFINSIAINVYHDGRQGLAQHFDDAVRFKQPIYTLRLFSDARLSFGSQFYGFCNGAFILPLPRGCILVMHENSYAANGVKHCVRPCDMTGKSAAVILRQMHTQVVNQASKYDELVDFPAWLSCLSENQNAITYAEQKRLQTQHIMKVKMD